MAVFVLIPGAGLGGWAWQKVARRLQQHGHAVYAPSLTGEGDRKHLLGPDVDLNTHVDDVANILDLEDLQEVTLVGHSYGGVVATGAADRAPGRVARLVYVDAPMGWSHLEIFPPAADPEMFPRHLVDGIALLVMPSPELVDFYGIRDPEEARWMLERLTPHPWKASQQRLDISDPEALEAIPRYHVLASRTVEMGSHDGLPDSERKPGHLFEIDGPHALMATHPDALTDILIGIADKP